MYRIITDEPESDPIGASVSGIWVISTLEVALRDDAGQTSMVLQLGSYALETEDAPVHGEGYWAPPNVAYPIPIGYAVPGTVGSLKKRIENAIDLDRVKDDMEQLAYSMGFRDADVSPRGQFIEIKVSPRTPGSVKAYCIMRWGVERVDSTCIRNLADPDTRKGFVFLPIGDSPTVVTRQSDAHGRKERWFLGKPIISNVDTVLSSPSMSRQVSNAAVSVPVEAFFRREYGTVCVVDLAGYGSAVQYANTEMHTFAQSQAEIATFFRHSVASRLERMAASIGTTQVHTAGDGLIAALPQRSNDDLKQSLVNIFLAWDDILEWVQELNTRIMDVDRKIGSRIAVHRGDYYFGRIGGLNSFSPSFDGDSIIEAARLEQSLGIAMKREDTVGTTTLRPRGNFAILSPQLDQGDIACLGERVPEWSYVGTLDAAAKEYKSAASILQYRAQ